ncbi:hypothetical protein J7L13_02790, partial [bacterium]|nr:hypothetical protein [bacterium]
MKKEWEIIYLEPDEEIPSVVARLQSASSKRVILVVPKEAILIHSIINLKLLLRQARKFRKEVYLVTADKIGQNLASKAGLPVFGSIKEAQKSFQPTLKTKPKTSPVRKKVLDLPSASRTVSPKPSPAKKKEKPRPLKERLWVKNLKKWVFSSQVLGAMVLFGVLLGLWWYFPRAEVVLYLKTETKEFRPTVRLGEGEGVDLRAQIFQKEVRKSAKGQATGEKEVGAKARGKITIYNYWDSTPQVLIAHTRFQSVSTGKIFRIPEAVTVPGTRVQQGQVVPGTVEVEVVADEVGAEYN